jgi:hypothetical protein
MDPIIASTAPHAPRNDPNIIASPIVEYNKSNDPNIIAPPLAEYN